MPIGGGMPTVPYVWNFSLPKYESRHPPLNMAWPNVMEGKVLGGGVYCPPNPFLNPLLATHALKFEPTIHKQRRNCHIKFWNLMEPPQVPKGKATRPKPKANHSDKIQGASSFPQIPAGVETHEEPRR